MSVEERLRRLEEVLAGLGGGPPASVRKFSDFSEALRHLRAGRRVHRQGWNGRGMWLALQVPDAGSKMTAPYVYMSTADGKLVPWLCSQTDLLADDWLLFDEPAPQARTSEGVVRRRADGSWDIESLEQEFKARWREKFGADAPLQALVEFSMGMRQDCERQPPECRERTFQWR